MLSEDIAISVDRLTKTYRLFDHPAKRVKQFLSFGLKQYHREFTALRDISFEIRKGETVGIIGRNGAGKSTLLQLICGILRPTVGSVYVNGRVSALLELGAGFNPEFTGRENVYFQGALTGFTQAEMDDRFWKIADFADIGEFIDQPVRTYSSGMFVRLAFATLINVDADILVIDEALAVGDAAFTQKCLCFLADFRLRGTLILVSHDQNAIMSLCDRVLWIEGRLRQQGSPQKVCESYIASCLGVQPSTGSKAEADQDIADQRQELLNTGNLRNDLEIFSFDADAEGAGTGQATLLDAWMENPDGIRYHILVGGEPVTLVIRGQANAALPAPVLGFIVKDRLGRPIIGDNTYLSYATKPVTAQPGESLEARFRFRMPRLPVGEYTVCVTLAEGLPGMHQTHHRINAAFTFHSQTSSVSQVLVGLPMHAIELEVFSQHDATH
jgi:lipopolysaccharide transport system ATP-binding protein